MLIHANQAETAVPIQLVDENRITEFSARQSDAVQAWMKAHAFRGERNKCLLVPDTTGQLLSVLVGVGKLSAQEPLSLWHMAGVPERLPEGTYMIADPPNDEVLQQLALGWLYGQYRFERYKKSAERRLRRLCIASNVDIVRIEHINSALSQARDWINAPANDMTPAILAQTAVDLANEHGATVKRYIGDALLANNFPTVHAVGRAATVAPELVDFNWGNLGAPKITLVGKGVCFDSGGLDIKPPSGMFLMKKDMGGAACTLALAQLVMQAQLPVHLRVIIPAVENAVAGNAFRPGDVIKTRSGLTVEVGNTDAEGRLILCDALALADEAAPDLLIDMATLTGAARVALGPELPALFTRDLTLARELMAMGEREQDPVWHLPLWAGYDDELSSRIADLNNVSTTGFSGAIIGGLYLQRFVNKAKQWLHLDLYAWNGKDRPGRPSGAEAQCVRTLFAYLRERFPPTGAAC
jgi:leucyl aminopeptidase